MVTLTTDIEEKNMFICPYALHIGHNNFFFSQKLGSLKSLSLSLQNLGASRTLAWLSASCSGSFMRPAGALAFSNDLIRTEGSTFKVSRVAAAGSEFA